MTTTIIPGLGTAPLYTQQGVGTTPGYTAIDRRRLLSPGVSQEGVDGILSGGAWMVTQRAAGATMTVDIAANSDYAYVLGDSVGFQGLYPVPPHTAVINEAITPAHATLPRIDIVVLEVLDHIHDGSGLNLARVRVIAGTATSGATLTNRTNAAALPPSCLLLADVLVAGGAGSITNAAIRDRRKWARGAYAHVTRNANAAAGSDYTTTSTTLALIDGSNLAPRIECSGAPVRVRLIGMFDTSVDMRVYWAPQIDSVGPDGFANVGTAPVSQSPAGAFAVPVLAADILPSPFEWTFVPSSGSHIIAPAWCLNPAGTATLFANANRPMQWVVEELPRQDARNNSVTTG